MTTSATPFLPAAAFFAAFSLSAALAHPHEDGEDGAYDHDSAYVHENGVGADPDGDTNPATDTRVVPFFTDAAEAADDPPYAVITFEPPPGRQNEAIIHDYEEKFGVTFGRGLSWQICRGQRHFQYDSMCTYAAPTSGQFAAGYLNYLNSPLRIEFARPVCIVTMSIYPTGGKEGEPFEFKIEGWTESGDKLAVATTDFEWTNDTVRWRNMAGVYFVDQRAKRITVSMRSLDPAEAKETLRYLIDDFAFVDDGCDAALEDIAERTGVDLEAAAQAPAEHPADLEEAVDSLEISGS